VADGAEKETRLSTTLMRPIKATSSTRCSNKRCGKRVYWNPDIRGWRPRAARAVALTPPVAIRCAWCLRVFCLACSQAHFKAEEADRLGKIIAEHVVVRLTTLASVAKRKRATR